LTSNRVVATVLTPPFDDKAVSLGYKKFMQLGDLADIPYVGLVTSQNEIKTNRESVRRTVAAVMESLAWLRTNRAESTKMIVDKFKVNQQEAENTYATLIRLLNKDGRLNLKVARGYSTSCAKSVRSRRTSTYRRPSTFLCYRRVDSMNSPVICD